MLEHTELGIIYNSAFKKNIFVSKEKIQELPVGKSVRYSFTSQDRLWSDLSEQEQREEELISGLHWFVDFKIVYKDAYGVVILITEAHNAEIKCNNRFSTYYHLINEKKQDEFMSDMEALD